MKETTFEMRIEDTIRQQVSESAGVVKVVYESIKKKNREDEQVGEDWGALARIKANRLARRVIKRIRPQARFTV